ncbi:MAG: hypothetical protein KZQ88_02700 [Candidatus Thiodiazotropha sp. (ex Dulcina madagascariensis)]|nr:hypothetical protein [Candidatus Thiodiazotropha sp. (ex Dulcina madagascariensis)]MCU7926894.1 hypothetical protein [Candidatus Thiodiazotropha sp. (ex Dulcina madagascariensis)]
MHLKRIAPLLLLICQSVPAEPSLPAMHISQPPLIDGHADDPAWSEAQPLVTRDTLAGIDIELRALYDDENIYLLAVFADPTENREHKPLLWNPNTGFYDKGIQREDTLVLKWAISPRETDLSLSAVTPYKADIWYWKSVRTDPVGHADDKFQLYSAQKLPRSLPLLTKNGSRFYLIRRGDSGKPAYRNRIQAAFAGERIAAYDIDQPEGSRGDIRAKGSWQKGFWRVEFARKLDTGHADDIIFLSGERYQFGVSRYEIAGRKPDPSLEIPLFGSGEVGERLILRFAE